MGNPGIPSFQVLGIHLLYPLWKTNDCNSALEGKLRRYFVIKMPCLQSSWRDDAVVEDKNSPSDYSEASTEIKKNIVLNNFFNRNPVMKINE